MLGNKAVGKLSPTHCLGLRSNRPQYATLNVGLSSARVFLWS